MIRHFPILSLFFTFFLKEKENDKNQKKYDMFQVNGGPIASNHVIEQNYKKRISLQKNILMKNLLNKNGKIDQENKIPIVKKLKEVSKHIEPAVLMQHPDDIDFYCLRDTQTEEKKNSEDYQFSFRGRKKEIPRNYLMDTIEESMFDLKIESVQKRASKPRKLRY